MSLTTPTIKQISDNIVAQLEASLAQTIPWLPKTFSRVLAKALAGVFVLLYKYAGFMSLQQFVRTAQYGDTEVNGQVVNPLLEWGRLVGVSDPRSPTRAELSVEITVENQGGVLPANSQLIGPGNGVTYITLAAVPLDAATKITVVRAVADQTGGGGAGVVGNVAAGEFLSFAGPLPNVARAALVLGQAVTGADGESEDSYRQRVLDRFRKRPQGGAKADYEQWGEEAAGIANVYPYTSEFPGQVDLYVEATPASAGNPDGIPTEGQLQSVLDLVNLDQNGKASRRPVDALVNAYPITRSAFDVAVGSLSVDNVAQVREDIQTALVDYFLSREPYIPGLSSPPRVDRITRTAVAGVVDDIVTAAGGVFGSASVRLGGVNVEVYSLGIGEKAKLGALTWL